MVDGAERADLRQRLVLIVVAGIAAEARHH
jgi:hypothetical protein